MNVIEQTLDKLSQMLSDFLASLPLLGIALVIVGVAWLLTKPARKYSGKLARRIGADATLQRLVERVTTVIVLSIGAILGLSVVLPDMGLGDVFAALGFGGVAIGFAFRSILENYVAGVYFLIARPFTIGNIIETGETRGYVEDISSRAIQIRGFDKELVVVPCGQLFTDRFTVVDENRHRRFELPVGVAYDTDLDRAEAVILKAVNGLPGVADEPEPFVVCESFDDSSISIRVYYFVDTHQQFLLQVQHTVGVAIKKAFDREGIEIPFPIRTLVSPGLRIDQSEPSRSNGKQAAATN